MTKIVTVPLIKVGTIIEVPIENVLVTASAIDYYIDVNVPTGVTYSSSSLPKGTYDSATNRWTVGSVTNGELIQGLLYFEVTDDSQAPFSFTYLPLGVSCDDCCVIVNGLTCYQLNGCLAQSTLAKDERIVAPVGTTVGPIDLTTGDGNCANKTYSFINNAGGKLTGTPQAASYTPGDEFFGTEIGSYGLYCNGSLISVAQILLCTSYAAPTTQWLIMPTNSLFAGNVGSADTRCTEGGTTTFHLKNAPTADGAVTYMTTSSDVTVTNWNQSTGNYQVTAINSFEGVVFFDYFIRCTINGQSWDSAPGQEVVSVTSSYPFSSSVVASSSAQASSSNAASSSQTISSSNPASSSQPASSSDTSSVLPPSSSATSSIVPASSSILIPSSNPAASSSVPFSSSNPVSSSQPVSSGVPASSSFVFLSSSNAPSSST